MSVKQLNYNLVSILEELPDEALVTFVGGAVSTPTTATPSPTSNVGKVQTGKSNIADSSITNASSFKPGSIQRQR